MSEESDRMLNLLQELAAMKRADKRTRAENATIFRERRKEIRSEMKQLANEAKKSDD